MAVEIGTASNARDLVSKLEKFLTTNPELVKANQAWEVLKDSDGGDDFVEFDDKHIFYTLESHVENREGISGWTTRRCFVGHGLDGEDTIVVPMGLYVNKKFPATPFTATSLCALYATEESKGKDFLTNFSKLRYKTRDMPFIASIPLRNDEMSYWFVANGRRFIVVVKAIGYYLSMYCGYMLQFGTDLENPYPMYLGASYNSYYAPLMTKQEQDAAKARDREENNGEDPMVFDMYGHTDAYGGGLHDPYYGGHTERHAFYETSSCVCNTPNNRVANLVVDYDRHNDYHEDLANVLPITNGFLFPYRYENENGYESNSIDEYARYPSTPNGKYALYPIEIVVTETTASEEWSPVGWLQGVYYVSGASNTPEKELIIGDKRYLCFPSMNIKSNRWFALLME